MVGSTAYTSLPLFFSRRRQGAHRAVTGPFEWEEEGEERRRGIFGEEYYLSKQGLTVESSIQPDDAVKMSLFSRFFVSLPSLPSSPSTPFFTHQIEIIIRSFKLVGIHHV